MANILIRLAEKDYSDGVILFGKQLENEVKTVCFDFTEWKKEYGNGTITAMILRPQELSAYPKVLTVDGNTATLHLTQTETELAGSGSVELCYVVGNQVCRSQTFRTFTFPSIAAEDGPVPDPYESWLSTLVELGNETRIYAERAESAASHQPTISADGTWLVWDADTSAYVDTGVSAKGQRGENGKVVDVLDSDGNSVVTNGVAHLPEIQGGGISGMKIGGNSIPLIDGVATIQELRMLGVGYSPSYNALYCITPQIGEIAARAGKYYSPVTLSSAGDVVRACLTDGKDPAWSAQEQAAAQERLGIKGWETIVTFTPEATTKTFVIPFSANYKRIMLTVDAPSTSTNDGITIHNLIGDSSANANRLYNIFFSTNYLFGAVDIEIVGDVVKLLFSHQKTLEGGSLASINEQVSMFSANGFYCRNNVITGIKFGLPSGARGDETITISGIRV